MFMVVGEGEGEQGEREVPGRRTGRLAVVDEIAGASIGTALAVLAAVRRGKAVHPIGVVYHACLSVRGSREAPRARLLCEPAEHRAIIRFSRSIGLPRPIPDLLGMSIRVLEPYGPGRHQDLLLVSSIDRPVLHHIFVPALDVWQRPYSSSLPYRAGSARFSDWRTARFQVAAAGREGRIRTAARRCCN